MWQNLAKLTKTFGKETFDTVGVVGLGWSIDLVCLWFK